jgi:hypothetical protein
LSAFFRPCSTPITIHHKVIHQYSIRFLRPFVRQTQHRGASETVLGSEAPVLKPTAPSFLQFNSPRRKGSLSLSSEE